MDTRLKLVDPATGQTAVRAQPPVVLSSAGSPWRSVMIDQMPDHPVDISNLASPDHRVCIQLSAKGRWEFKTNGAFEPIELQPGQAFLVQADVPFSCRARSTGEMLVVSIDPKFLLWSSHDLLAHPGSVELRHGEVIDDALVRSVGQALKREAESNYPGGRSYGEALATALAVHIVRQFSVEPALAREPRRGLGRAHLRKVMEFVAAHLSEEISLQAMADVVDLSPFHFARRFKQTMNVSPHQYVIQCRVERARERLQNSRDTIAQIAQSVGFCDQSHLTTHFRRVFGVTPKVYRDGAVV